MSDHSPISGSERPANWQRFTLAPSELVDPSAAPAEPPVDAVVPDFGGDATPEVELVVLNGVLDLAYRLPAPVQLPSKFKSIAATLISLDLSRNSLKEIPLPVNQCTSLQRLILDGNELETLASLPIGPFTKTLSTLWINTNAITDLSAAVTQISLAAPKLSHLSALFNPGSLPPDLADDDIATNPYRQLRATIIHKLPGLLTLDALAVSPEEKAEALKRGAFMTGVHVGKDDVRVGARAVARGGRGSPVNTAKTAGLFGRGAKDGYGRLDDADIIDPADPDDDPLAVRDDLDQERVGHARTFVTKGRTEASGKYSEGNRFIRDAQL